MAELTVTQLHKDFGDTTVLRGIDLHIDSGQFVALLGASGCGKSTLLRCIAGLEAVTSGTVTVGGEDVTALPPEARRLSMMFQSYALFPHMTALENVRFPLRMAAKRWGSTSTQRELAAAALEQVQMGGFADRMPRQLSGGQQQRVALARTIVNEPRVLLLDEPLSNLDARLRHDMQLELITIQRRLGLTTVLVTHDQDEALSMADQVVLMQGGRIEQQDTPERIYTHPASTFAADFLGAANLVPIVVTSATGRREGIVGSTTVPLPSDDSLALGDGAEATLVLRQEQLALGRPPAGHDAVVPATVVARIFRGRETQYVVSVDGVQLKVLTGPEVVLDEGNLTSVSWSSPEARVLER
jgi:putative spermidine/putrescine transport system ATP-binding protein